jgi:hypothetical protein
MNDWRYIVALTGDACAAEPTANAIARVVTSCNFRIVIGVRLLL